MDAYVFGEAHLEYAFLVYRALLDWDSILTSISSKVRPDEQTLFDDMLTRFSDKETLKDYVRTIDDFKIKIKEFYEPLGKLASESDNNTLFIEGSFKQGELLETHLANRGINSSLFSKIQSLDIKQVSDKETLWRSVIIDNMPSDGSVFMIMGLNHVSRMNFSSKLGLYIMDTSFMSNYFRLDAALLRELMFRK